MLYEQLENDDA